MGSKGTLFTLILFPFLLAIQAMAASLSWQAPIEIHKGPGIKGPWQQNQSNYHYVDDLTVEIHGQELLTAWVDQKQKDIFFQKYSKDGKKLGDPINISKNSKTFSWIPRIAVSEDRTNDISILWQEIIFSGGSHGGDMLLSRSQDGGKTFSYPLNLSRSVGGDGKGRINQKVWSNGSYDLVSGPKGKIIVAWTEFNGPLWISISQNRGETFSNPMQIAGDSKMPVRGPSVSFGPNDNVFVAWTYGENEKADIMIQVSADGGQSFGPPRSIAKTKGYSDSPKIAVDPKGVLHLAFAESSKGPFDDFRVRYTRSSNSGKSFETVRTISEPSLPGISSSAYPDLSIANNDIYIIWELFPTLGNRPQGLGLAISSDRGRNFSKPKLVPHSASSNEGVNGSQQGYLMSKLAVDESGFIAIANSSLIPNKSSRIWLTTARNPKSNQPTKMR